jgi:hypothetical protein
MTAKAVTATSGTALGGSWLRGVTTSVARPDTDGLGELRARAVRGVRWRSDFEGFQLLARSRKNA